MKTLILATLTIGGMALATPAASHILEECQPHILQSGVAQTMTGHAASEMSATYAPGKLLEFGQASVKTVQRSGYPCDTLTVMNSVPLSWKGRYVVACNNDSYTYVVDGLGIKAPVTKHTN